MKIIPLLLLSFMFFPAFAQKTIPLRNLWERPQVHVLFEGYTISFTIKDINRALTLLAETGDKTFGASCGLDTAGDYIIELYSGTRMEYRNQLQSLIQNGVGAFLLNAGHAYIENKKHKKLETIISDRQTSGQGINKIYYIFYDPRKNIRLFTGNMAKDMYGKDLGIDY